MIIGILNQKGGVGKTTLATSIAHELSNRYIEDDILLVDADPQQSTLTWSEMREDSLPFVVVGMPKKTIHKDLPALMKHYRYAIIDGSPRTTDLTRSCIMACDLVVIPVQPSPYDIWASEETIKLIEEAKIYKENLRYVLAVNRKIANTAISRDVVELLKEKHMRILENSVCQRVIYAESAGSGQTVFDLSPNGKASHEIRLLVDELLRYAHEKESKH